MPPVCFWGLQESRPDRTGEE
uniref:Uncharacterized protein n=1 Tax=Anguilla anguilla TaxID=7936 RepID=A0A0E9QCY3_ANGAN